MVVKFKNIIPSLKIPKSKKDKVPVSLRSVKDEILYTKKKQSGKTKPLHKEKRISEWKYWALIDNDFPYSAAFKIHHMLIPKRIVDQKNLSTRERNELNDILEILDSDYDCLLINFKKKQSIRNHFHIHLLTYKDKRKEMKL